MDRNTKQILLISGALLFLIGLIAGVAVPQMPNPRMGLSAHLAGVQNALFLLAAGAAWGNIRLSARMAQLTCWLGIGSMYGFWAALQLAAIWGTSRATPIAGAGFQAAPWRESTVELLLRSASAVAILAAALLLLGFWKGLKNDNNRARQLD